MVTIRRLAGVLVALTVGVLLGVMAPQAERFPPAAGAGGAEITIYGRDGTFGSYGDTVPSGQRLARRAVPGWGLPPGRQAAVAGLAGDGTVFLAGRDHDERRRTGDELVIAAYEPRGNGYSLIRLRTSHGRDRAADRAGAPAAPSVTGLETIAGGAAVAFTAGPALAGQDIGADGVWPVFGIMTKVDGRWQVAGGAGWSNQWTGAELRAASPGPGEPACPAPSEAAGHSDCRGLGEMAALPRSGDIVVAQRDGLAVLRVTGPDLAGRFAVAVTTHYLYPAVANRGTADPRDRLAITVRGVYADPTGGPGDERFAVMLSPDPDAHVPNVVQEFSYDAAAGRIRPVSAPILPGDGSGDGGWFYGFGRALYDHAGNLWLSRHNWLAGGNLAVYSVSGGQRRIGGPQCPFDPKRPLDAYRTAAGGKSVWGQTCRPDYDIIQARAMLGATAMVEDPVTHDIVVLSLGGTLLPVRASGSGAGLTFQIGAMVDTGPKLLPSGWDSGWHQQLGVIDDSHRLWYPVSHFPAKPDVRAPVDQWLYAVSVGALFDPAPVDLPGTPGQSVTIQAEQTTTTTTLRSKGAWAATDIDSVGYRNPCMDSGSNTGCGNDGVPGNGFVLADSTGYGHLEGTLEYRVRVPSAGNYRLSYRVSTFAVTTNARIELSAGGRSYTTAVSTDGGWRTIREPETVVLAAGEQTIRLAPADRGGGWYLNSFTLQRT